MKRGLLFFALILAGFLLTINFASASIILSDQGSNVTLKSNGNLVNNGNLTVTIWTTSTGGSPIYNQTFVNAIQNGQWDVQLGATSPLNLQFNHLYYKGYQINGYVLNFTNATGQSVDRQAFYSPLGNINTTSNITASHGFFSFLGSLLNPIGTIFASNIFATNVNGTLTGNGAGISGINAGNIASGTLAVARGGTGTTTSTGSGSVVLSSSPSIASATLSSPTFSGTISAGGNRVTNVATPTASTDAATKSYVDAASSSGMAYSFTLGNSVSYNPPSSVSSWTSTGMTLPSYNQLVIFALSYYGGAKTFNSATDFYFRVNSSKGFSYGTVNWQGANATWNTYGTAGSGGCTSGTACITNLLTSTSGGYPCSLGVDGAGNLYYQTNTPGASLLSCAFGYYYR